ncbi:MAG: hypothetical protein JJT82_08770 [Legionellaceae bacterium]|nr:hypothetical protein [Legionellaceae bacterium]
MSSEDTFSPMFADKQSNDFSPWELSSDVEPMPEEPVVDVEAELAAERAKLHAQAREKGYAQGMREGQEAARKYEQELQAMLQQLVFPLQQLDKRVDEEVLLAVRALCHHCIGIELSLRPEKLMAVWQTIKKQLPSAGGKLQLRLSAADSQWMQDHIHDDGAIQEILQQAQVDERLQRGDFQLDFPQGLIDGRVATRIKNLVQTELGGVDFSLEEDGDGPA